MAGSLEILLITVLLVIAFGGGLYIRTFLTRRAIFRVVEIFYDHDALGVYGAKTLKELGLESPDFLQRMTKPRDYRQTALQVLIREGVVNLTEDGRVYLIEEKLDQKLRRRK